jgi:hypothetical protein
VRAADRCVPVDRLARLTHQPKDVHVSAVLPRDAASMFRTLSSVVVSCLMAVFAVAVTVIG